MDGFRAARFVPNSQRYWDNSKNWPTNYGPAYRDVNLGPSYFVPCTEKYALCFSSGPEPLPCELDKSGRFAKCKCTVESGINFVLITSILNAEVYQETLDVCGTDGSACSDHPDQAPVCQYLRRGRLIPGSDIISTFNPQLRSKLNEASAGRANALTQCPKGPYAGCMTAGCKLKHGYAECNCPVFYGPFQLTQEDASCDLGDDLIWSASYTPAP